MAERGQPFDTEAVASALVGARRRAQRLTEYPGRVLPPSLDEANEVQEQAIRLWRGSIVGWKVGFIPLEQRTPANIPRFVGPVWRDQLRIIDQHNPAPVSVDVFGTGLVEVEYVIELHENLPDWHHVWTVKEAMSLSMSLHVGLEVVSSPVADLQRMGPIAIASDFGFNNGLVVGPRVESWKSVDLFSTLVNTYVDGEAVGAGSAENVAGGIGESLAQSLTVLSSRGRPLRAGEYLATGALTGAHTISSGSAVRADFGELGTISCECLVQTPCPDAL